MSADLDLSVNSCNIAASAQSVTTGTLKISDQLDVLESGASNLVDLCGIAPTVESASRGRTANRRDDVADVKDDGQVDIDLQNEGIGDRKSSDSGQVAAAVQLAKTENLEIRDQASDRKRDECGNQKHDGAPPAPARTRKAESEQASGKGGDGDECKTPTSEESKIPPVVTCPAAPRKPKPTVLCKRKLFDIDFFEMVNRADVDTFFQSHSVIPKQRCRCV